MDVQHFYLVFRKSWVQISTRSLDILTDFLWFSAVPPFEFPTITTNYVTTVSSQIPSNTLIINRHTIRTSTYSQLLKTPLHKPQQINTLSVSADTIGLSVVYYNRNELLCESLTTGTA